MSNASRSRNYYYRKKERMAELEALAASVNGQPSAEAEVNKPTLNALHQRTFRQRRKEERIELLQKANLLNSLADGLPRTRLEYRVRPQSEVIADGLKADFDALADLVAEGMADLYDRIEASDQTLDEHLIPEFISLRESVDQLRKSVDMTRKMVFALFKEFEKQNGGV